MHATSILFRHSKLLVFFSPVQVNEIQRTQVNIEALKAFPFIDDITTLKAELPSYLSASEDVPASIDFAIGGKTTKLCCLNFFH